jgi:hypothetical protein
MNMTLLREQCRFLRPELIVLIPFSLRGTIEKRIITTSYDIRIIRRASDLTSSGRNYLSSHARDTLIFNNRSERNGDSSQFPRTEGLQNLDSNASVFSRNFQQNENSGLLLQVNINYGRRQEIMIN